MSFSSDSSDKDVPAISGDNTAGGDGIRGESSGNAVFGVCLSAEHAGVLGANNNPGGKGVVGMSSAPGAYGVQGLGMAGIGLYGRSESTDPNHAGVKGVNNVGQGVKGESQSGHGVLATSDTGDGLHAVCGHGTAVWAQSGDGRGGVFMGDSAQVQLMPAAAAIHPTAGETGDLFVDVSGRLWFCQTGGPSATWKQLA